MPVAIKYAEPQDQSREQELAGFNSERQQRTRAYNKAMDYYLGKQKRILERKDGEPDDNVILNLIQLTADRTVNFIFPSMPKFELDTNNTDTNPQEEWISQAFEHNGGLNTLQKMALIGFLGGHVYIRVKPPRYDDVNDTYAKFFLLDPSQMITYWKADDIEYVLWHEQRFKIGEDEFIIDFVNNGDSWEIIEYAKTSNSNTWEKTNKGSKWNHKEGPIVHWQHLPLPSSFYGLNEARDLELQDTLNLIVGEMARIVRYHSTPRTVIFGVAGEEVQETGIDKMWSVDNTDARIENLEMQSELVPARELALYLQDTYLAMRRVVILRGEVKDFQRVTNTGVRTVFMDMLAKRNILIRQYSKGLQTLAHIMQLVSSQDTSVLPVITNIDPLPLDEREAVEVGALKVQNFLTSRETVNADLDQVWSNESMKMQKEAELNFLAPKMPMFGASSDKETVDEEEG